MQATGQDLLAHVQAGANGRSLADGPKPGAPASALHGLSGIRPEMLAGGDMRLQGRKKKLNESELWEVNQLKKSGVLTVEEQPDFDDEHGFVRALLPPLMLFAASQGLCHLQHDCQRCSAALLAQTSHGPAEQYSNLCGIDNNGLSRLDQAHIAHLQPACCACALS